MERVRKPPRLLPLDHSLWSTLLISMNLVRIQMTLIQNQLNIWIYRLGVPRPAAWRLVREKLQAFFERRKHQENSIRLRDYLFAKESPHKAFMVMKFARNWRTYDYEMVPNVLLEGLEQLNGYTNHELEETSTSC